MSPLMLTMCFLTGIAFPEASAAQSTTRLKPEQQGTSMIATVTLRTSFFFKISFSFSP